MDAALGDLALAFRTLGGDVRLMPTPRLDATIGPVHLDVALHRMRLSAVIEPAGEPAAGTRATEAHRDHMALSRPTRAEQRIEQEGRYIW